MRYFCAVLLLVGLCHGVSEASQCTSRGRFPDNEIEDCRGYTICLIGGITNFTQYKLTCPAGFVYSHFEMQCTNATGYRCLGSFNCTTAGNFSEPNSEDCRSYVTCVEGVNGLATARLVDCPEDSFFDASKSECVNSADFKCNLKSNNVNVTEFINSTVILYDFSTNTNNVHSGAHLCKNVVSLFWFLIIFFI